MAIIPIRRGGTLSNTFNLQQCYETIQLFCFLTLDENWKLIEHFYKTLLIDNGSTLVEKLALLSPGQETVVGYDKILSNVSEFSFILLSGSSKLPAYGNESAFAKEITLIQNKKYLW
jgi:hypothetical protein